MQVGEEQPLSTSMGISFQTVLGKMEVYMVFCLMLLSIFGITQLRDSLMLRYGSFRGGGICKTISLRQGSNRWFRREDSNSSTVVGLQAMKHAQCMRI
jgi:hypothetical protein